MKCELCKENHARYIALRQGQILLTCAICPIKHDLPSVRIIDIKMVKYGRRIRT